MINLDNITFRPTFKDLQVGDVFFTISRRGTSSIWSRYTVTRLTDKMFYWGYGVQLENGRHEYESAYRRDTGKRVGGFRSDPNATLPTVELVEELRREREKATVRMGIRAFLDETRDLRSLRDEEAVRVFQLFEAIKESRTAATSPA